jgi:hypothetical protein
MITKEEVFEGDFSHFDVLMLLERIAELEANQVEPLYLYDFISSYEGLKMMQLWDWLMYNGYTRRAKEQGE